MLGKDEFKSTASMHNYVPWMKTLEGFKIIH